MKSPWQSPWALGDLPSIDERQRSFRTAVSRAAGNKVNLCVEVLSDTLALEDHIAFPLRGLPMTWQSLSEGKLWDFMNEAWDRMSIEQRRLCEVIRVSPQKWKLTPWGDQGGGFWVVGIIGNSVLWYNDIEDGFNRSKYSSLGTIDEY